MNFEKYGKERSLLITGIEAVPEDSFYRKFQNEELPYKQVIDILKTIIARFGNEIYLDEERLNAIVNDLVPNILKEKNIIRSAISFGMPRHLLEAYRNPEQTTDILKAVYQSAKTNGLNVEWCAGILFIFGYPLGIDSRKLYPLETEKKKPRINLKEKEGFNSILQKKKIEYSSERTEKLKQLSEEGDTEASLELGMRYYSGSKEEQDYKKAAWFYRKAETGGNPVAQYNLGFMYSHALGVEHDNKKAFDFYRKSAEQNFVLGQLALGEMYYNGQGCEKNDKEAVYWLQKAEQECDDASVYISLAMILKDSKDDSVRNTRKAFEYTQKAVAAGDETAFNLMGTFYENGTGVPQNYKKAFEYYSLAAENGVEIAYLNMGACYQQGYGTTQDFKKAAECFQHGADVGNMYCLNALAMCYKHGQGVKRDSKKAFDLFLKSAYAGNYAAEFNVGLAYAEGQGVLQDPKEAKNWFALSAGKGFGKAMAALGIYAEKGIPDGKPDLKEAFAWYLKSANAGDYGFSQWILGNCRTYGLMNSYIDKLEGFEWYLKAAYNGYAAAQTTVAAEYLKGVLLDQDYDQAVEWFEKATAQDEQFALNTYGTMLVNGTGVKRNAIRGFQMIKRAAELGNSDAKVSLGICCFEGWGTSRDLDAALKWLSEAYTETNNTTAEEYLNKGFRKKNGSWVKRGILSRVPDPEVLPPEQPRQETKGGCNDFCKYYAADKRTKENRRNYCRYFEMEVFTKKNCPYYEDVVADIIENFL